MSVKYVNIYIRSVGTFSQMLCVCVCERGKGDGVQGLIDHSFEYLKIDTKQNPEKCRFVCVTTLEVWHFSMFSPPLSKFNFRDPRRIYIHL